MDPRIIYEAVYPQDKRFTDGYSKTFESSVSGKSYPTFSKFSEEMKASTELLPIPFRKRKVSRFIQEAIKISLQYELDAAIYRHDSHISVVFSFDCGGCMGYMKPIFALADNYSFFISTQGREISVCLDYYTHYLYRNGRIVAP